MRELEELTELLDSVRLLTLTGAGGSGKTRLARELADRCKGNNRDVFWIDLAPISESNYVADTVAAAMGIAPDASTSPVDRVIARINNREMLLVLDNCEHLVGECAELVELLLRRCKCLVLLSTSREAFGIASEVAWLVPPLDNEESTQLFAARAEAASPTFTLSPANLAAVREICRRLDGIPLAIELAAARIKVLTPEQIASRLDDAFRLLTAGSRTALPRHRTLRGTMDWSYDLLLPRERTLLRRLSVFSGGFSLEAAENICADRNGLASTAHEESLEPDDVLDGVAALVDKSLVVMEPNDNEARYHLLEIVKQYAAERLGEASELDAVRESHARYFLALAESIAPRLVGGEHESGLVARTRLEHENMSLAAGWASSSPRHAEEALRFAHTLFWYWYSTGYWLRSGKNYESRDYLRYALEVGAHANRGILSRAWSAQGLTCLTIGDHATAKSAFEKALELLDGEHDQRQLVLVLSKLAATTIMLGEFARADELLARAKSEMQAFAPSMEYAFVYFWDVWGWIARKEGKRARDGVRLSTQLAETTNHRTIRAHALTLAGRLELLEGNRDEAAIALGSSLKLHRDIGDAWGLILDLDAISMLLSQRRVFVDAVRLMGAADALRERLGISMLATDKADRARQKSEAIGKLGVEAFDSWYAEGKSLGPDRVFQAGVEATMVATAEFRVPDEATHASASAQTNFAAEQATPSRLRVHALGPLEVLVNEQAVESSAWGSARPRELLVHLLMYPDGRTKEQVGLAFWPEASNSQLRNNFHVTIHRLRKALGASDWIVLINDRYRLDPSLVAEFDAARFELEINSARAALKRSDAGAVNAMERALALFRGDFLDGEPAGDWHLEFRDHFQRLFVDGLMELGSRLEEEGRASRAAEAYRRVLARDELHEAAVVALMRTHAQVGERAKCMRIYERFADRLHNELGAKPNEEMRKIFSTVQQGREIQSGRELQHR